MRGLVTVVVAVVVASAEAGGLFRKIYSKNGNLTLPPDHDEDAGDPLFLTPLLEANSIQEAQTLSHVQLGNGHSFSGFLTVNKTYNSNLFFWFFPAKKGVEDAPVVVWLQGGPGSSSLFGLFAEHGPFSVNSSLNLVPRNYSWTQTHNMLYIDNPAGTGFSFTRDEQGYARNQSDVGRDLYAAVVQFFALFPELKHNDFYVTGESYAGKYVPALAYTIHKNNPTAKLKINLKGLAIGDGFCDPVTMTDYSEFLYQVGLIDANIKRYFKQQSDLAVRLIKQQQWVKASHMFDCLLNNITNITGLTNYFNYLANGEPKDMEYWTRYINQASVRKAIHVGNLTFHNGSVVARHLESDTMQSVKPWIEELLDNYRVMIYNGQLDIIIAYTLTENFINSMQWKYAGQYRQSPRYVWREDGQVAGYVKEVPGFVQVMVRNAGHMIPYDQPKWAYDMINRFTAEKSFA